MAIHGQITCDPALPAPVQAALLHVLQEPPERVRRVAAGGQAVWVKQAEQLSLRWRLQKGDPQKALEAERRGLHDLAALGLPVAPLVAEGPGFLATLEVGRPLNGVLADGDAGPAPFQAAGEALGALHRAGVAHGRPSLRDILWDGRMARFIDFERYRPGPASARRMAVDLLVLVHSIAVQVGPSAPEFDAALEAWRTAAPDSVAAAAGRLVRRSGWLGWIAGLVIRLRPSASEWAVVPGVLAALARKLP